MAMSRLKSLRTFSASITALPNPNETYFPPRIGGKWPGWLTTSHQHFQLAVQRTFNLAHEMGGAWEYAYALAWR